MAKKAVKKTAAKTPKAPKKLAKKTAKPAGQETNLVLRISQRAKNPQVADFAPGDSVNVYVKVKEGEKERIQLYKGVVTKLQGKGVARSFTVRKISAGIGIEKTSFASPAIEKVERLTIGQVRRAKLYYLRGLAGKAAKINSELVQTSSASEAAAAAESEA